MSEITMINSEYNIKLQKSMNKCENIKKEYNLL